MRPPPPCGFTLFDRFLTGPELTNVPGLFPAREVGLADALGWELEAFREAFEEVSREGLAAADWKAGLVWVPNAIRHNEPESPNVILSWEVTLADLPDCRLKDLALQALESWCKARGEGWAKAWAKAYPKGSGNQEQEQEQEQEQTQSAPTESGSMPAAPRERHIANFERSLRQPDIRAQLLFEAFRAETGKSGLRYDHKARELFEGLLDEGVTADEIRIVVQGAKHDRWATDTAKMAASALLGSSAQRTRFIALARDPPRAKGVKAPRQPNSVGGFGDAFCAAAQTGTAK
jgi:hypothetical protein